MEKSYQLTARQLYYLGKLLEGRYIDYSYVSAISNILDSFTTYESEIISELSAKGYLSEDFSGQITIDSNLKEVLNPIFNGERESSLDICRFGEMESLKMFKFHSDGKNTVQVRSSEDSLEVSFVEDEDIREIIQSVIPTDYANEKFDEIAEFESSQVQEVISIKNAVFNNSSLTKTYVMMGDVLYQETEENVIHAVSKRGFIEEAESILLEVM